MSYKKRLSKIGNEYGVVLDGAILKDLNINTKTTLEVTVEGDHLIVKPIIEEGDPWAEAIKKTGERYGGDFLR